MSSGLLTTTPEADATSEDSAICSEDDALRSEEGAIRLEDDAVRSDEDAIRALGAQFPHVPSDAIASAWNGLLGPHTPAEKRLLCAGLLEETQGPCPTRSASFAERQEQVMNTRELSFERVTGANVNVPVLPPARVLARLCSFRGFDHTGLAPKGWPPRQDWLMEEMQREWTRSLELEVEWRYVTSPIPSEGARDKDRDNGRPAGHTPAHFLEHEVAQRARLTLPLVVALRLYTGPGYKALNQSLREHTGLFRVTLFALHWAIIRLGRHERRDHVLFRGLKGQPSEQLKTPEALTSYFLGEPGVMSTTRSVRVAREFGCDVMFVVLDAAGPHARVSRYFPDGDWIPTSGTPGLASTGAPVEWVTQYPGENEVVFPPSVLSPVAPDTIAGLSPAQYQHLAKQVYFVTLYFLWDSAHDGLPCWGGRAFPCRVTHHSHARLKGLKSKVMSKSASMYKRTSSAAALPPSPCAGDA